jgi:ubiquinone/menaquinone biosynthesis C-methylase UbiE
MPFLLRAADVTPGMRVLDIATGTGLSAAAALDAVGPTKASPAWGIPG